MDLAFGDSWAAIGYGQSDVLVDMGVPLSQAGTSTDGTTWTVQQTQAVDTYRQPGLGRRR